MPSTLCDSVSRSHTLFLQTIYVDQLQIFGDDGGAPSPVPSPTATPVTPPVTPPAAMPVAAPVAAPVTAPVTPPVTPPVAAPVSAPVATPMTVPVTVGPGIVGSAVYVQRVGVKGVNILAAQEDGTALVVSATNLSMDTNGLRVLKQATSKCFHLLHPMCSTSKYVP